MQDLIVVDVHSHVYTETYAKVLQSNGLLARTPEGDLRIGSGKRTSLISETIIDVGKRMQEMKNFGFRTFQILSISRPWTYFLTPVEEVKVVRGINNEAAEIVRRNPDTFGGLATLPLHAGVEDCIEEAERAVKDLGLNGFIVGTGIGEKTIDSPEFGPLLDTISRLDRPIFLHPGSLPLDRALNEDFRTGELVNYLFETSFTLARLILSGALEGRRLKVVAAHGGGFLTYQFGRLDRGYEVYPDLRARLRRKPSEYLKEVYFDSIVFSREALFHLLKFAGTDHVMFGTDYPFRISDPPGMKSTLDSTGLGEEELRKVYQENAERLYKIRL